MSRRKLTPEEIRAALARANEKAQVDIERLREAAIVRQSDLTRFEINL